MYRRLRSIPLLAIGTITHVSTLKPVAALTFDDGPNPIFTPRLLDILQKHHAKATFFMVGQAAERYPDLVRKVSEAGHAIGNHSWDHPSFPLITGPERRAQIRACAKAIAPYAQNILRPPYGDQNLWSRLDALWLGYQVITWNGTAGDWLDHDADWIRNKVMSRIQNGSIIVLHDSIFRPREDRYADREPMLHAVDMLLLELSGRFSFITIPELLQQGRPQRQYWRKQTDVDFRIKERHEHDR
ncbi:MAG: polysaccharide deacetylase family protein [Nitrospira sp.]|nr:polysaccharide deacetylase family protein [Nitrospira sp.]